VPVFAGYGEIEKVSLVRGPDNKSRGCCMVRRAGRVAAAPGVGRSGALGGGSKTFARCSQHIVRARSVLIGRCQNVPFSGRQNGVGQR